METGITLIITLHSTVVPYNTFFLAENSNKKIVGTSSMSIAIFGIDNKTFDTIPTLKDLIQIEPSEIREINKNGSCVLNYNKIFRE